MRISLDTEIEEIAELKHAIAILEDAIKRRENEGYSEDEYEEDEEENLDEGEPEEEMSEEDVQEEEEPEKMQEPQPILQPTFQPISQPAPQPIQQQVQQQLHQPTPPTYTQQQSYQQPLQQQVQQPPRRTSPPPSVDMSALSMSDVGKGRNLNDPVQRSSPSSSPSPSMSPRPISSPAPQQNSKEAVKNIIVTLKDRAYGGPIQMQDIINLAKVKNISESETRRWVNELQNSNSI